MKKIGLIGIGKMGISHLSILGAHPQVEVVGVVDTSTLVTDIIRKYTPFKCYENYNTMLNETKPDAVIVSVPTKYHEPIVRDMINKGIHVFVEKPFCIGAEQGSELIEIAKKNKVINQVGYHNKFIGTFIEANKIIKGGYIGDIIHFSGEMNGPVVTKRKEETWRSKPEEGGGCLMDYAAHLIDLINYLVAPIKKINGADLISIYSKQVEDAVYSLVETENGIHGNIQVNWSDETFRKMATAITIIGTEGKIIVDSTELKVYFKNIETPKGYSKGWNTKQINQLSTQVDFYLRGEEYSSQIDYFIDALEGKNANDINTFKSAWETDNVIELIKNYKNN
jgi:predicted dehydrogenase